MKRTFSKEFMQENCGCYTEERLEACSFMQGEEITIESIINSEIPLKDKFWFACRKAATIDENKQIAIEVAECVLRIYEAKYQNNKAPRNAIEAAKKYIKGEIGLDELLIARRAAYAYAAAAYAYADDAAAYAAAYADAYADDAYKTKLLSILNSYALVPAETI